MPILSTNTKVWLHGLIAAFVSTFATSASGFITLPSVFSFTHNGIINMIKLSTVPAMITVFGYLKASPLPALVGPGDVATIQNPSISPEGTVTGSSATLVKAVDPATLASTIKP